MHIYTYSATQIIHSLQHVRVPVTKVVTPNNWAYTCSVCGDVCATSYHVRAICNKGLVDPYLLVS